MHHFFADDSQLYRFLKPRSTASVHQAVIDTELSVAAAQEWMLANKLKCNADKTELIVFTPSRSTSLSQVSVSIGGISVGVTVFVTLECTKITSYHGVSCKPCL